MTIKELESNLNQVVKDNNEVKVRVEEAKKDSMSFRHKNPREVVVKSIAAGSIRIYLDTGKGIKDSLLFSINPPHENFKSWYVDWDADFGGGDAELINLYADLLKITYTFLKEKEND